MSSKKICFYSVATHLGGAEKSLLELLSSLEKREYEVWILLPKMKGPLIDQLKQKNINFAIIKMPDLFFKTSRSRPLYSLFNTIISSPHLFFYFIKVFRFLKRKNISMIYSTGIKCHALAAIISVPLNVPVVWHLRDIFHLGPTLLLLKFLKLFSKITLIANSEATAKSFTKKLNSISVIHNGIDPKKYPHKPNNYFHKKYKIKTSIPVIGILGAIAKWKGQKQFIQMAQELINRQLDAHFIIIGDELYDTVSDIGYLDELKKYVDQLGISSNVHFTGYLENTSMALNGLDVLVHASIKPEPFGRVIIEAMSCGIPVVAAADGGVFEIMSNNVHGILYPPGNIIEMSNAVEKLVKDDALRQKFILAADAKFKQSFTNKLYTEKVIAVFKKVV